MPDLVLNDVALFDGTGAAPRPGLRVELAGGRIARVAPALPQGATAAGAGPSPSPAPPRCPG